VDLCDDALITLCGNSPYTDKSVDINKRCTRVLLGEAVTHHSPGI